ncbi:MAG: hypothetical protein M3306_28750 [Actinomycetota bacterium]|nr:hypothetical protein [Actinomycetota bacterium]
MAIVVMGFLIVTVLRLVVPLSIIGVLWVLNPSASGWMVLATVGISVAAMHLVETCVELPLCRLWGLPIQESGRPREDFCPAPQNQEKK